MFLSYDHLHLANAGWNGGQALQYHTYVMQEVVDSKNEVAMTYGGLLDGDSELPLTGEGGTLGMSVMCRNRTIQIAVVDTGNPALSCSNVVIEDDWSSHWVL